MYFYIGAGVFIIQPDDPDKFIGSVGFDRVGFYIQRICFRLLLLTG